MDTTKSSAPFTEKKFIIPLIFVTSLFMIWGIAMTMGDVLNRHFQNVLNISKADSSYVQMSIFGAYGIMGIPAGLFMKRFGYKSGVILGLALYAFGCSLFVPAANAESFSFFRLALFILACGMATLETVAHPFVAALGDQRTSDQRINFAQSFNGVGAVVGPLMGTFVLLKATGEVSADHPLDSVKSLYLGIASVIAFIAICFAFIKVPQLDDPHPEDPSDTAFSSVGKLFKRKHFVWAVIAQFFNVAAQGGTWAYFINYGVEKMGFTDEKAGYFLSLSMVMMMVGRFFGTALMRVVAPNKLLAAFALGNILMCVIIAQSFGWPSYIALLMLNFFFSIMFPTIFSLGLKDLGPLTQQASSFIVMGVLGGAFFPRFMGMIAEHDVATAYYLPIICYAVIFAFATKFYKTQS